MAQFNLPISILLSLVLHLFLAVYAMFVLEKSAGDRIEVYEVFSVTLEGGENIGGVTQVPQITKESTADEKTGKKQVNQPAKETVKKIEAPTAVEQIEKKVEEDKKKQEEVIIQEKKKKEEEQKKKEEEKKKQEEAKKNAEKEKQAKEEEEKRAALEKQKKAKEARDKKFKESLEKFSDFSQSESTNAGGQGVGAARLGGNGGGGGTLASLEFIAYRNQLETHIKSGWRWLPGTTVYQTIVEITLLPSGQVQNIAIIKPSGNDKFDDSVYRAVQKASPVPPPPEKIYDKFRVVKITFDSHK